MQTAKLAVVAIGGNALIRDRDHESIPDQFEMVSQIAVDIAGVIEAGWNVVLTHGNGPQIGFILRRSEFSIHQMPPVPMDYAGADIQGALGWMFVRALRNEFRRRSMPRQAVAVVTQTLVDRADPAFTDPSKPIGSQMDEAKAKRLALKYHWTVRADAGRGNLPPIPSRAERRGLPAMSAPGALARAIRRPWNTRPGALAAGPSAYLVQNKAAIEIADCDGLLCGRIVWLTTLASGRFQTLPLEHSHAA